MNSESKNKYVKMTFFLVGIVLAMMLSVSCNSRQAAENTASPADKTAPPARVVPDTNATRITFAQFNELKEGMSYKEVVEIIGGEGRMFSVSSEPGKTEYRWEGRGRPGANADITFQEDRLINKVQFGLQ